MVGHLERRQKPQWVKDIVRGRMEKLLVLAEKNAKANPTRARRYASLAFSLSKKYNVRIPARWRQSFCRACFAFFVPGKNVRVRADRVNKRMVYTCLECNNKRAYGYGG